MNDLSMFEGLMLIFNSGIHSLVGYLQLIGSNLLLPLMFASFALAVICRALVFYTIKRESWFAQEFEKRVDWFMVNKKPEGKFSFVLLTKKLLEKTYYELFEVRSVMKRRKPDQVMSMGDRVFLIQQGAARLVGDTVKQIKYVKYRDDQPLDLLKTSKKIFENNSCFTRVFGLIPAAGFNDILNILPGVFVIAGIFGTFLGIMNALPGLSAIKVADVEQTGYVMQKFLDNITFSMSTSIIGILFSVSMNFINTLMSPEKLFVRSVNSFESSLNLLWNVCANNDIPENMDEFNEHRDPLEALAEESLNKELRKKIKWQREAPIPSLELSGNRLDPAFSQSDEEDDPQAA